MDQDFTKLAAATELKMYAEYMANWNVDSKGEVKTNPENRKKAAIGSKSFLEDAIRLAMQVNHSYVKTILDSSSQVTKGFMHELTNTTTSKINTFDLNQYLTTYSYDVALPLNGKTLSLGVELASQYAKVQNKTHSKQLLKLFDQWGVDLQIVNDLGDFLPKMVSTNKSSCDRFSDIKNNTLTPPLYLILTGCDEKIKEEILSFNENTIFTNEQEEHIMNTLFNSGSYKTTSKALKRSGREIKKILEQIQGLHEPALSYLKLSASMFETSTIYHRLNKLAPKEVPLHKYHDAVIKHHIQRYRNIYVGKY